MDRRLSAFSELHQTNSPLFLSLPVQSRFVFDVRRAAHVIECVGQFAFTVQPDPAAFGSAERVPDQLDDSADDTTRISPSGDYQRGGLK